MTIAWWAALIGLFIAITLILFKVNTVYSLLFGTIVGSVRKGIDILYNKGMYAIFSCVPGVETLEQALVDAQYNVERVSENIARLI